MLTCLLCGKQYHHLGSHVVKTHKITAREYKEQFELDYAYPLIDEEVKRKKQIAFAQDRIKYLANLTKGGKRFQFRKGKNNRTRFAYQSLEWVIGQAEAINKNSFGQCPVCRMKYRHMNSHLYNKHNLLIAKK